MPRGGKRAGAGRRPLLDEDQRHWAGARYCELVEDKAAKSGQLRVSKSDPPSKMITEAHERLAAVPLPVRQKRAAQRTPIGEGTHAIDEAVEDVRAGAGESLGDTRLTQVRPIRPYRARAAMLKQVADEIAVRYGVKVSPGYVADCIDEWRKLLNELQSLN